jgi:tripartite-type tricarboxylate transporter receptor subunit TctC
VIVENRPGGAGLIAAREAAKSPPDGHTLLLALINNAIGDVLKPDPCCRLNQELLPVSRFTMTPLLVVVNPSLQVRSLVDYIQLAKQKRGALTYASHGPGSIAQLVGEWIKTETGTEILEVPYKAVNAELTDLAGGQVMTAFPVPQVVVSAVKSGKLRALAVLGSERINVLPDVPTAKEAGLPGMEALAWNGIFVPAGTPRPVIDTLHRELVKAYNAPDVKKPGPRHGLLRCRRHARGVRGVHPRREREVGQGHPRGEDQARIGVEKGSDQHYFRLRRASRKA